MSNAKIITICHNGFHGHRAVSILATTEEIAAGVVRVSPRVAARINKAVCPHDDCQCGEGLAEGERGDPHYVVRLPRPLDAEMRGNYPQA